MNTDFEAAVPPPNAKNARKQGMGFLATDFTDFTDARKEEFNLRSFAQSVDRALFFFVPFVCLRSIPSFFVLSRLRVRPVFLGVLGAPAPKAFGVGG
jgi:hypothetical protein